MTAHEWEWRVEPGVKALSALHDQILDDLDTERGGVEWWNGMTSGQHLVLLADYLIQSLSGASASLEYAAYAAVEHRSIDSAMDFRMQQYWRQGDITSNPLPVPTDSDRKAEVRRAMSIEQVLYHLVQCLDRMAPALLIVGAINVPDVRGADWGTLTSHYRKRLLATPEKSPLRQSAYAKFSAQGTASWGLQERLFEPLNDLDQYGKPDWITW